MRRLLQLALLAASIVATPAFGDDSQLVEAKVIADRTAVSPGSMFRLGVEFAVSPGWHIYYHHSGDAGRPTTVELVLPPGAVRHDALWERPSRFDDNGFVTWGYERCTIVVVPVVAPQSLAPGDVFEVKVLVTWLACKESCLPGSAELVLRLPVVADPSREQPANTARFAGATFSGPPDASPPGPSGTPPVASPPGEVAGSDGPGLAYIMVLAFVGGLLLNLMPCVLPVVSLKILSFVRQAGDDRRRIFASGLAYTAGTLCSFLALALAVIVLQSAGMSVGWGFQFQHPLFVLFMAAVVTVMALSLFGLFFVQVKGGNTVDRLASQQGLAGDFGKGVSATILSTPCTAPFLGTAVGFAFSQPWWATIAVFLTVGAGLAAPYLVLSWQPSWLRFLPKPGMWMEHFKQAMGFLLLATAIWLLSVLGSLAGAGAVSGALVFLLSLGFGSWIVGQFASPMASSRRRLVVWAVALSVSLAGLFYFALPPALNPAAAAVKGTGGDWPSFSETALKNHLSAGKVVVVDFTADWCLTCKLNEQVLAGSEVASRVSAGEVVVLKADWTRGDPEITRALKRFGRSGVPLIVVYSPLDSGGQPEVLPELVTPAMVRKALDRASGR